MRYLNQAQPRQSVFGFRYLVFGNRDAGIGMRYAGAILFLAFFFGFVSCSSKQVFNLESPDGNIRINLSNEENRAQLLLFYKGDTIVSKSLIGLEVNGENFIEGVELSVITETEVNEDWSTINGKNIRIRNHYNEYVFQCKREGNDTLWYELIFRLYDDGFAYRYNFPGEAVNGSVLVNSELTSLLFYPDFTHWSYNGEHHNAGPVKRSEEQVELVRPPMVMKIYDDLYMSIAEAAIFDFAPFNIDASGKGHTLSFSTDYSAREEAFHTSWRAFIIGSRAGDLVESNLLVNLNEPCKIEDPSWIKPGKTMWDWRVWGYRADDGFEYGLNTESHKRFIDFAAENNVQYLLMDADWYGAEFDENSDPTSSGSLVDIEENMRYAKEKGVGIFLYLNDVGAKKFGLERVLKQFADWGASGVKYGFMTGSWEDKVHHTRKVVELCAKYRLMVIFHDNPVPPSGDRRTWPNLVSKEFCHSQADAHRSYWPETVVNQVLINMIAGPIDGCNGWFDLNNNLYRVKVFEEIPGTVAAEVAKLICIYSGLSVLPDSPEEYLEKSDLFDCIRNMPGQFDSFQVLDGEIDEFVCVARKAGDDWFIGSLTNREARTLKLNFNFLPESMYFEAVIYEDADGTHFMENKESYKIRKQIVNSDTVLEVKLAPGGGCAIHLRQKAKGKRQK